jgi:tetratricopeptide (TPR) repeat protein
MATILIIAALAGLMAGSRMVPTPEEVRASFKQGQKFYASEDYEQAIEMFEEITGIESSLLATEEITEEIGEIKAPIKEIALYQTGNSYFKQGGETQFKSRRAREPKLKEELATEANEDFLKAANFFSRSEATSTTPKLKALARNRLVSTLYESGDFDGVGKEGQVFEERYPGSPWLVNVLYNVGWAYFDTERYPECIEVYQRLIRHFPQGFQADRSLFQIAEAYYKQEDYEAAIPWYRDVVDGQGIEQMTERQLLRMRREKLAGLVDETALELAAKAQIKIGDSHSRLGNIDEALTAFEKVIVAFSQEQQLVSEAYIRLADMYYQNGDYDGAVATYQRAIDSSNNRYFQAGMQSLLAEHFYKTEDFPNAIAEYKLYLDAYADVASAAGLSASWAQYKVARAHFELADRHREASRTDSARIEYERAIDGYRIIETNYPESELALAATKFNVALCFQMLGLAEVEGGTDKALKIYTRIVEENLVSDYVRSSLLQKARILYQGGEFAQALSAYERIMADFPEARERHAAKFEMALCHRDLGRFDTAIGIFQEIEPTSGLLPKAMLEASRLLSEAQDFEASLAALDKGLKNTKDARERARFHYMKGRTLIEIEDFEQAVDALALAASTTDEDDVRSGAIYGRGVSLLKLKRYAEAVAGLEPLLESDNQDLVTSTRRMIGLANLEMGREREAIEDYTALVRSSATPRERVENMIVLSELYYGLENFTKVEEICREIIAMDFLDEKTGQPYFLKEKAYFLLGDTFNQRNDINSLIAIYREAVAQYPNSYYSADMNFALGQVLFEKEDLVETVDVFTTYLEGFPRHPNRPYGLYYMGYALFNLTRFEGAAETFGDLAEGYPDSELAPDALFRAGEARYNLGQFQGALGYYETLLENAPDADLADDASYNLAWALLNLERDNDAMVAFEKMAADYPKSPLAPNAQFTVGDFLYNEERYKEAIRAYEDVARRFPSSDVATRVPALLDDLNEVVAYTEYAEAEAIFASALESDDKAKFRQAIDGFTEIAQKYPKTESAIGALSNMGVCYESLGQWKKAVEVYDLVLGRFSEEEGQREEAYRFAQMHKDWIVSSHL